MTRRWMRLFLAMGLGLWASASRAVAGEGDAHALVEEGKRLYAAGQFAAAQEKFAEADVLAPENRKIAYDRALAYQAVGDLDKAEEHYRAASLSADAELNARTWFNLGDLEVARARAKLGPDPVAVAPAARPEILEHLERAVGQFRNVLDARPGDADARYNIEVIRLFVKDLEDRWRKADRERARKEADLLGYLEYLMTQQEGLEHATEILAGGEQDRDRPVRLEQTRMVQEELRDEMPHLRTKVKEHIAKQAGPPAAAPGTGNPPPPPDPARREALEKAEKELLALVDAAEASMKTAVEKLQALALSEAASAQHDARESLFTMWKGLADFSRLLARAIREEDRLVAATEPLADASAPETDEAAGRKQAERLSGDQSEVRGLVPLMTGRARAALQQLGSQPAPPPGGGANPPGQPDPAELRRAFEKALDLLPKADRAMEEAGAALEKRTWPGALEKEKEAAKILKEIRDLFPKQKQDQQQNQPEPKPENKDGQQADRNQPPRTDRPSPEEAERLLQKMRENRKQRERQRREAEVGRRIHVEKDW